MHVYMFVYVCICVYMCVYVCVCVYVSVSVVCATIPLCMRLLPCTCANLQAFVQRECSITSRAQVKDTSRAQKAAVTRAQVKYTSRALKAGVTCAQV